MIAKKCDRCGALYEEYNTRNSADEINGVNLLNIDNKQSYYFHGPYDLCPACADGLMRWFKKDISTEAEKI